MCMWRESFKDFSQATKQMQAIKRLGTPADIIRKDCVRIFKIKIWNFSLFLKNINIVNTGVYGAKVTNDIFSETIKQMQQLHMW